jgi:hypothetical protein
MRKREQRIEYGEEEIAYEEEGEGKEKTTGREGGKCKPRGEGWKKVGEDGKENNKGKSEDTDDESEGASGGGEKGATAGMVALC